MTLIERAARGALVGAVAALLAGCAVLGGAPGRGGPDGGPEDLARLRQQAASDSTEAYWPFRIAEMCAQSGRTGDAEVALDEALRRDPSHAPSLCLRSQLWYHAGRHDDAIALLEDARAQGPFPDELGVALALHYDALGRLDEAADLASKLEDRLHDWSGAGAALAYLRLRGEDFDRAEDVARRALDAKESAVNENNYGVALLYAGRPQEARDHFERATDLDPALPGPLYNLAIVDHFYFFDSSGARRWFDRYRTLASDDPDGLAQALSNELADTGPATAEVTP